MIEKTHVQLLKETLSILNLKELYLYEKQLINGVRSPDFYYRVAGHFYNPETGRGIRFFGNAREHGIRAYKKAVECYKRGKKEKAFFFLEKRCIS